MGARLSTLLAILVIAMICAFSPRARAASDPALAWYTIETPHFRITYHSGVEEVAQHVANICEDIHDKTRETVGWTPGEKTEILLSDFSESANGSATSLPYNAIRLLVTAPEDMSPLGDVDDWYLELTTHEYTHVLHTDNIRGIPAIVNAVLGKTFAPNQVQPRWILEGLGVYHESARTSGGRLRNSQWDMLMRTDVLEDNVASIDQVTGTVRRWPQGNLYYLYGSYFIEWIAETYGEEALRKMASDYGKQLIPWGFNRSIKRATGSTFVDMYPAWIESMKRRYGAQAAAVRAKGVREGVRLTHNGQIARHPRWIPKGAWPEHEGGLLYYREDQRYRPGFFAMPVEKNAKGVVVASAAAEKKTEHVARTANESFATFDPDGGLVFGGQEFYKNVFLFGDLERLPPGSKSSFGTPDGGRVRLTESMRAAEPAVSPDGRRVVFTINRAGTRSIHIADLRPTSIENVRPLVTTSFLEQAFTPRWSPDGTHVAYSVWKRGGYRDIRYVDVRDGTHRDLTRDRAVDGAPSFSADGRYLYFHSDRTGIMNVYAWEIATDKVHQVTNVTSGAFMPEPSPDGKNLAYIGYTSAGYDVFSMPLDPSRWTEAEPYVDERPPAPTISTKRWKPKPYSAWPTLIPRRYGVQVTEGSFGRAVIVSAAQADLTGFHIVSANSIVELEQPTLQGTLGYSYARLPFNAGVSLFRSIAPRAGFQLGQNYKPTVIQESVGFASSITYDQPSAYDARSYVVTHSISRTGAQIPIPIERLDPYETPQFPARGFASTLHFGYAYSNAERYLWSVGPERGYSLALSFDVTHPGIGSDFEGFVTNGDFTTYFLMPWLRHHSLALHLGAGTSGGVFPGRGAFYVGSFVDLPLIDTVRDILIQGGITLRGYPPVILAGRSYTLGNLEYRFPIVNVDRGASTLPFQLNRVTGAVFFDYGSAFDQIDAAKYKSGTGAEVWFDTTLGYVAAFTFRLGYARGLASGGIDKVYFVAAVPY
ncbi:MAG: PD40 domain-containing protein [Labilithrix sp.]|nr:PD40 domain-containing protein [Labilithrix sp.]